MDPLRWLATTSVPSYKLSRPSNAPRTEKQFVKWIRKWYRDMCGKVALCLSGREGDSVRHKHVKMLADRLEEEPYLMTSGEFIHHISDRLMKYLGAVRRVYELQKSPAKKKKSAYRDVLAMHAALDDMSQEERVERMKVMSKRSCESDLCVRAAYAELMNLCIWSNYGCCPAAQDSLLLWARMYLLDENGRPQGDTEEERDLKHAQQTNRCVLSVDMKHARVFGSSPVERATLEVRPGVDELTEATSQLSLAAEDEEEKKYPLSSSSESGDSPVEPLSPA